MNLIIFRTTLERACLQVRAEYRQYESEEGLNLALAKLKGILAGCNAVARALEDDVPAGELMKVAREVTERHQRELVRER